MATKEPMPLRAVRVDTATWEAARAVADQRGEKLSDVLRRALRSYASSEAR